MRIFVESITLDQPIHTMEVSVPDPEWRWTAANGVEYHVEGGDIEPEPDVEVVYHGCGNPDCWHQECWSEEVFRVPGTGERIDPPMIKQMISRPIHTRIFGKGSIDLADGEDVEDVIAQPIRSLDDPQVTLAPHLAGMRGLFFIKTVHRQEAGCFDGVFGVPQVMEPRAAEFEFQSVYQVEG